MDKWFPFVVLVMVVAAQFGVYFFMKSQLKGCKSWYGKIIMTIAIFAGLLLCTWMTAVTWSPITKSILKWLTSQGPYQVSDITAAFLLSGLCWIFGIWIPYSLVKYVLEKFESKIGVSIAYWIAVALTIYVPLDLTGITEDLGGPWWWTSRFMILIIVCLLGKWWVDYWFKEMDPAPNGQTKFAVFGSYVLCVFLSWYLLQSFGWDIFRYTFVSVLSLAPFLCFNLLIFHFSYWMGKPSRPLSRRPGLYLTNGYLLVLLVISFRIFYLQASGQYTWHEQAANMALNIANRGLEDLKREIATTGLTNANRELAKALKAGDLESVERWQKVIEKITSGVDSLPKSKFRFAPAIEKEIKGVKETWASTLAKKPQPPPPPRDVQWQKKEVTTSPIPLIRVYNGDKFVYVSPKKFTIVEEGGAIHDHNPSSAPGEVRSFPFYNIPESGYEIKIKTEGGEPFQIQFRVVNDRA